MPLKRTLSPRDLARAVGVSESSLKRWADDGLLNISRTSGGHRRIGIAEAAAYIRRSGRALNDSTPLGIAPLELPASLDPPLDHLLVTAVRDGQASSVVDLSIRLYLAGRSLCEICDGPLTHALRRIDTDPARRHVRGRSIDAILEALRELQVLLPPPLDQCRAVLSPSGPEPGSGMVRAGLSAERWQCAAARSSSPEALLAAAREHRATLVCLAVLDEGAVDLSALAASLQALGCRLAVVGVPTSPEIAPAVLLRAGSMSELASLARCVCAERQIAVQV